MGRRRRKFQRVATAPPKPEELGHGDSVRIDASCGTMGDDAPSVEVRGLTGKVVGCNPVFEGEGGEQKVAVQLDHYGGLLGVPLRALRKAGPRAVAAPRYEPGQFEEIFRR